MKAVLFQPYYMGWGGTEKAAYDLGRYLPHEGIELKIVVPGKGFFTERLEDARIPYTVQQAPDTLNEFGGAYYSYGWFKTLTFLTQMVRYNWEFSKWLKEERPDVVILNGVRASIIAGLAPLIARIPSVLYLHGYFHKYSGSRLEILVNMWAALMQKHCVAVSRASIDDFSSKLPRWLKQRLVSRCTVVYNWASIGGLSDRWEDEKGMERDDVHEYVRLGTLASIERRKGLHHLLEVAALLRKRGFVFKLRIGGPTADQVYFAELKELAKSLVLEDVVEFVGFVDPAEFLKELDIFLFASDREGMPLAIIEAMAFGLPIVAFEASGVGEALNHGEAGILVPIGDVQRMADEVAALMASAEARVSLGKRARERSRLFSAVTQIRALATLLKEVAKGRN